MTSEYFCTQQCNKGESIILTAMHQSIPESVKSAEALVNFFHQHYNKELTLYAFGLIKRFNMRTDEADDLLQDLYMQIILKWEKFRDGFEEKGIFYLTKSLKYAIHNNNRGQEVMKRHEKLFEESRPQSNSIYFGSDLYEKEFYDFLTACLNPKELETMDLYLQGFSYEEIAKQLNIAEGTVGSRIHKAKKKILKNMDH